MEVITVLYTTNWCDNSSCTTGTGFDKFIQLGNLNITLNSFHTKTIFSQVKQWEFRNWWQDRWAKRSNELIICCNPKEVCRTDFFNLSVGCWVKVDNIREIRIMGNFPWQHTCRVVTTNLSSTCTMWCCTVIFVLDKEIRWSQSAFEVVPYWHSEKCKDILICRVNTNNVSNPNQEWTKIKCCASTIWWDVFFISTDYFFTSIYKFFHWNLWHQKTISSTL